LPRPITRTTPSGPARSALLGVVGVVLGCSQAPGGPPNVVLAVLDTVRADHVSCYGYERRTTPAIDALAATGDRYAVARATSSWTLPSHASMLTGLYPFHHGAQARLDPDRGQVSELPLQGRMPTGEPMPTLAEVLSAEGYQTLAVVANGGYLPARYGLGRGFDDYRDKDSPEQRVSRDVNRIALEMLASRDPERPFFLFLNYMDAHRPYNVGPLPEERAAALPPPDPEEPRRLLNELVAAVMEEEAPPEPELIARVVTQYDYGIAHGDLAIEGVIDWLKAAGEWENTLFILTSDHGEFLGEHDLAEHSKDIYEEGVRVPLVVRRPGQRKGAVIEEPISLVEIPCLVLASLPGEARARHAGSFPCGDAGAATYTELRYTRSKDLFSEYGARFRRERTAIYLGPYKLIRSTDGHHELYDLERDPREEHNLYRKDDERSRQLLDQVTALRERADRGVVEFPTEELTEEQRRELRELGYFGDDE